MSNLAGLSAAIWFPFNSDGLNVVVLFVRLLQTVVI